jgi:hypothetical protein
MAATSQISSTFDISVAMDSADAYTIANPGRSFRIVNIRAYNAAGTPNITVQDSGTNNIAAAQATATNAWKNLALTEANCEISASENLVVENANASTTKVIITCVATGGGQTLTVTT